jgi:hypothetical protein
MLSRKAFASMSLKQFFVGFMGFMGFMNSSPTFEFYWYYSKVTSFRGTRLFTTICPIRKMVSTIAIATLENSQTVTVIKTVSLVNITLVKVRATGLGACMVFTAGIGFSAAVGALRKAFATDPANEVAKTLVIICTWTLIIPTNFCAINLFAT